MGPYFVVIPRHPLWLHLTANLGIGSTHNTGIGRDASFERPQLFVLVGVVLHHFVYADNLQVTMYK